MAKLKPITIVIAALAVIIACQFVGVNRVMWLIFSRAFLSRAGLGETIYQAAFLAMSSLSVFLALRTGLWNLGVDGQIIVGLVLAGLGCIYLYPLLPLPSPLFLLVLLVLVFGLTGSIGMLFAWLKGRFMVSEIIVTIMSNYMFYYFALFLVYGPLRAESSYLPQSALIPQELRLKPFFAGMRVDATLLLAVCMILAGYFFLEKTAMGYSLLFVRENPLACAYSGLHVGRRYMLSFFLSSGCAGITGMWLLVSNFHRITDSLMLGYGFTSVVIAILCARSILLLVPLSVLFAGVMYGAGVVERAYAVPSAIAFILQAVIVFIILIGKRFRHGR